MRALWLENILAVSFCCAQTMASGSIDIAHAWFRAMPASLPAAGYFELHNGTANKVVLMGATSPMCSMLMLHKSGTEEGMAEMKEVDSIPLAAGSTAYFRPDGLHLMCMDPAKAFHPGASVPVTLKFNNGQKVSTGFQVKPTRARSDQ